MNIYSRLLRLYRTNMVKTPLEDFTTEILAGILDSNQEILDSFVNIILGIEGTGFSVTTQECFDLNDPNFQDCRVDIVIRSENVLCFVENKVESREGYAQLERYQKALDQFKPRFATHLNYCTKYYDEKDIIAHNFRQFRWGDIYKFLKPWDSSSLISEYLDFLNDNDMSDNMDFTLNELLSLQELNAVMKKMDRYLEKIKVIFARYFHRNRIKEINNLRQIKEHSRYVFVSEYVFGRGGYNELGIGFEFSEVPVLKMWIWTDHKVDKALVFEGLTEKSGFDTNSENWIGSSKPLTDLISSENIEGDIENWFAATFSKLKTFIEQTPELDWHL